MLLTEPEDYLNAMFAYLQWRHKPNKTTPKSDNRTALETLDRLL